MDNGNFTQQDLDNINEYHRRRIESEYEKTIKEQKAAIKKLVDEVKRLRKHNKALCADNKRLRKKLGVQE